MKQVEIGKAFSFGWESIKKDFWYFIGISLIVVILGNVWNGKHGLGIISLLISSWLAAGTIKIALSYFDGTKLPFENLFTQIKYFWRVLGANLLICLIVVLGLICLIVPGIYFALRFFFTKTLIVDKDLGIIDAMKESTKMTEGIKWQLLVLCLAMLGAMILGVIAFGIGIFVAVPIIWLAEIYVYKKIILAEDQNLPAENPAVPIEQATPQSI
jgi:uncharacterized membrane protein